MLRAGTEWCSLCYADLRPREETVAPPVTHDPTPRQPLDHARQPQPALVAPASAAAVAPPSSGGKHAKHAKKPEFGAVTAPTVEVERLADQLLAELAATESGNPLGAVSGLVDTTGKRVALMVGGGLGVLLLLFVLMAVAGALL
jgi:hypothetical protein